MPLTQSVLAASHNASSSYPTKLTLSCPAVACNVVVYTLLTPRPRMRCVGRRVRVSQVSVAVSCRTRSSTAESRGCLAATAPTASGRQTESSLCIVRDIVVVQEIVARIVSRLGAGHVHAEDAAAGEAAKAPRGRTSARASAPRGRAPAEIWDGTNYSPLSLTPSPSSFAHILAA